MNIIKMANDRLEIDKLIKDEIDLKRYTYLSLKTCLSIELGELLNEWGEFKYWKRNHVTNLSELLKEWADCMLFGLAILNKKIKKIKKSDIQYIFYVAENSKEYRRENTLLLYKDTIFMLSIKDEKFTKYSAMRVISNIISLGVLMGFTLEQLEQIYYVKKQIVLQRIKSNY